MKKRQGTAVNTTASLELSELVTQFLSEFAYTGGSHKTLLWYKDQTRALRAWLESREILFPEQVTPELLRAFLLEEKQHLADSSIVSRFEANRRWFNWMVEQGHIAESPFAKIRRPKVAEATVIAFSPEEAKRLVAHARSAEGWLASRDLAIVTFLLGTGARADELLTLADASLDWTRHRVLLHGKGRKDRYVPMGPKVERALLAYSKVRPAGQAFWMTQRRTSMSYGTLNAMLHNLGTYAGVEDCRPHRFRHTAATEMARHTGNILQVKAYLGHSKIQTTERYLRRLGIEYGQANYETPDSWLV